MMDKPTTASAQRQQVLQRNHADRLHNLRKREVKPSAKNQGGAERGAKAKGEK
jgi:hypothetical protein